MSSDAQAIYNAIFPANAQRAIRDAPLIQSDIAGGYVTKYTAARPQDCSKAGPVNVGAYSQGGGIVQILASNTTTGAKISSFINQGLQAIPVVGQFLSQIWTAVNPFAHHAAAVAREQSTLCSAVPEFDQALGAIEAQLKAGNISAQDASAYVDQAVSQFDTEVSGISQGTSGSGTCNAGCVMQYEVKAVGQEVKEKFVNSPAYFLKHYWWVGAIVIVILFWRRS